MTINGIGGWMESVAGGHAPQPIIDRMLAPLAANISASRQAIGDGWGVGLAGLNDRLINIYSGNGWTAAVIGRPRFTDPVLDEECKKRGVAQTLANAYASAGEKTFSRLGGAFSAVVIDHARRSVTIAIDRMGIHSLTYALVNANFIFSTSCAAINAHPNARPEIDTQALYDYLYFHMIPAPGTVYRDYRRLLPGEYVVFEKGQVRHGQYWSMHFEEDRHASFGQLKEEFIFSLREAVREAADGVQAGCFLSGGTDSSTMSGLLGEVTGKPARTYSIGFDEPGYDETSYARIAAKHFGTHHQEYYVTPHDIVTAIPLIAQGHDQPFGNSSAVPTYYCARLAHQDGIERIIGGDGGDELFGGNERYAKQHVFSLYEKIPASLRNCLLNPLLNNLPENSGIALLQKAKSYVQQASVPMPARLETYNLLERIGREKIFSPAFLSLIDPGKPLQHLNTIYQDAAAETQINRMLALDFRITLADSDLPKVVNSCALAGMEVAFPMLADNVVAFSAKLAPALKLKGTKLRYFFKQALSDFLPQEIITKQKHGFGLPFGPWMIRHKPLQELVADSLQDLKQRGIIRPAFIDELTAQHLSAHAGYYGTMVWVLMILEQWLAHHAPDFSIPNKQ